MTSRIVLWVISLAALLLLVIMNLWTVPFIEGHAGGLVMFDNRPFGYSLDQVQAFLRNLEPEGAALYSGVQRKLDTLFPILFAIAAPWLLWILTEGWRKATRIAISLVGFVGPMFDLIENHLVAGFLRADPDQITAQMVALASSASVAKWVLDMIALGAVLLLSWSLWLGRREPT